MNYSKLQQEAARELYIRRQARKTINDYSNAIVVPGRPIGEDPDTEFFEEVETNLADHHKLILSTMEEISETPHGRAMFFLPPGSAKSTYASVVFPSKYLGAKKDRKVILASYGDSLAKKMGRKTRSIIKQPRYKGIFNAELTKDSSAAQDFQLTNGSEYMSCGILAGVTGNRAHGLIIDDPVKGRQEANSEGNRNKIWDAYKDDLMTRLIPGGWIALIMTRWHEDDLAGRILPTDWNGESGDILCKDGNVWKVLCLQAKCEKEDDPLGRKIDEYIWPEWFDAGHWAQFESSVMTWNSLYQQRPSPPEGEIMKPDNITIIDELPIGSIQWIRGWDFASTMDGDWTAGAKLGRLADGRFIIGNMVRKRALADERDASLLATAGLDGKGTKISIPQDPGQAGKTQVLYLTRKLAGFNVKSSLESGDKVTRAEPFAAQVNSGNVLMIRADWNQALVDELRVFPNGTYDDQVDALSRAFTELIPNATRTPVDISVPQSANMGKI